MLRHNIIELTETIKFRDRIDLKIKDPTKTGKKKIPSEGFSGYVYSYSRKKNSHRPQVD